MRSGAEEIHDVLDEIRREVDENPCGMGDVAMRAMATALRTLFRSKVPKRYSREQAARALGISTRQLSRIVSKKEIVARRDGFRNVYFTEEDIQHMRE